MSLSKFYTIMRKTGEDKILITVARLYLLQFLCQAPSRRQGSSQKTAGSKTELLTASTQTHTGKGHHNNDLSMLINKQELSAFKSRELALEHTSSVHLCHVLEEKILSGSLPPLP